MIGPEEKSSGFFCNQKREGLFSKLALPLSEIPMVRPVSGPVSFFLRQNVPSVVKAKEYIASQ